MERLEYTCPWTLLEAVLASVNTGDNLQPYLEHKDSADTDLVGFQTDECLWVIPWGVAQSATLDLPQYKSEELKKKAVLSYLMAKGLLLTEPGRQQLVELIWAFVPTRRRTLLEELSFGDTLEV